LFSLPGNNRKSLGFSWSWTHDLLQQAAAHAAHADAERELVAESSSKLHHLQLGWVSGPFQGHRQQSADP